MDYPEPKLNPNCQCRDNPLRAFHCQFGHMLECHYPYTCPAAACSHLAKYDYSEDEVKKLTARAEAAIRAGQMVPYEFDSAGNIIVKIMPDVSLDMGPGRLTLARLVADLLNLRSDRGSLVGMTSDCTPCLLVLMLNANAVQELGIFVRDHMAKFKADSSQRIQSEPTTPIKLMFDAMREVGLPWTWMHIQIGKQDGLAAFFVGPSAVDETFANGLTARGCITNLK